MPYKPSHAGAPLSTSGSPQVSPILLTPKEAARLLNLSVSWLAKHRLAGDGPPYIKMGGAVRYSQIARLFGGAEQPRRLGDSLRIDLQAATGLRTHRSRP